MYKIAIFSSGNGSNAENIVNYFSNNDQVSVSCILTNNPKAYVIKRAKKLGIKSLVFNKEDFTKTDEIVHFLTKNDIKLIILAGFLLKIPQNLINVFPNKIVNIHPALLPKFGGKGMFGNHVHKAVIASREKESGITIHYVNENYDEGKVIFQAKCAIEKSDTYESLAKKIHTLEYEHYPRIIEQLID